MKEDRRRYNGGHSTKGVAGRKSKALEQKLIEKLKPMNPIALKSLRKALNADKPWAIKLYFEYFYGRPQQRIDVTSGDETLQPKPLFAKDFINVPADHSILENN